MAAPWLLLAAFVTLAAGADASKPCPIQLVDGTAQAGITFRHTMGGSGRQYTPEFMVGGLATFDYDGDDLLDIFLLNGAALPGTTLDVPPRDALYRNNGDGTFSDVTEQAGVGDLGHGLGVTAADYDNDGDQDLYLSHFGENVFYCNNGDGTFTDISEGAGVRRGPKFGAGVAFLDLEQDGDLDLYVGNYIDFSYERHAELAPLAYPFPPGPQDFLPVPDNVFRNNGDGTFTDVSVACGVAAVAGPSMGLVSGDFDEDGDADVFVCNDAAANFLFVNDGRGHFQEQAAPAGVAFDLLGNANGSMGVDCADYDNDGLLDLFLTNYTAELPVLYRNLGGGLFEDATRPAQAGIKAFPHVNWGTGLVDFDNDADRDLFLANGHFLVDLQKTDQRTAYRVANMLLMNEQHRFVDVSDRSGSGLAIVESSRGAAFDDLDNDGDVDAVVLNVGTLPTLLRNESATHLHWLQMRLCGVRANRNGVGARVRVVTGSTVQTTEVHSGRGYQSHFGTRVHFGLGPAAQAEQIEVRWPGGRRELFRRVAADQLVILREGSGEAVTK